MILMEHRVCDCLHCCQCWLLWELFLVVLYNYMSLKDSEAWKLFVCGGFFCFPLFLLLFVFVNCLASYYCTKLINKQILQLHFFKVGHFAFVWDIQKDIRFSLSAPSFSSALKTLLFSPTWHWLVYVGQCVSVSLNVCDEEVMYARLYA